MKALVISSEPDMARLIEIKLRKEGHHVVVAQTGEEGLEHLSREEPAVIILDPQVPGEHGVGLVRHLKRMAKEEPVVVVLSAEAEIGHIAEAFAHGADDFVAQPFSPQGLLERVQVNLIRRGRLQPEIRVLDHGE